MEHPANNLIAFFAFIGSDNISKPFILTSPSVEEIKPVIIFIVVVFPAPFGPRKPSISPSLTVKLIPSTAV